MKKGLRFILTTILILAVAFSAFCINGYAAAKSVLIFESTVQVNKTFTVTLKLTADEPMYSTGASIFFDSSKVRFNSGNSANLDGDHVIIVGTPGGAVTQSYTLNFTAIAAGETRIEANNIGYVGNEYTPMPNASDKLTITSGQSSTSSKNPTSSQATVSKNANLSSLRVKDHELSPAFASDTTSYTVIARYPTEQVSIFASTENANATYVGAGTYDLKVGDNERIITVTAQDGKTKKSYFVTIKRLSEQETAEYDLNNEIKDPLALQIDNTAHHIAADLTDVTPPTGFATSKIDYKGTEITVFQNADQTYTLYWITNDETKQGEFYTYDSVTDQFTVLPYIAVNDKIYILAALPKTYAVPAGYSIVSVPLGNQSTTAFMADDPDMKDFYMLYLHYDGVTQFYRFDQAETTLQRAPYFALDMQPTSNQASDASDLLAKFQALSQTEKILLFALGGAVLLVIVLLIVIVVLVNRKPKTVTEEDDLEDTLSSFMDLEDAPQLPDLEEESDEITEEDTDEKTSAKPQDEEEDW